MTIRDIQNIKIRKPLIVKLRYIFQLCRAYNMFRHHHITFVWNAFRVFTSYQRCDAFYLVFIIITGIIDIKIQNVIVDKVEIFRCEFKVQVVDVEFWVWIVISLCKLKLLFRRCSCVLSLNPEIVNWSCRFRGNWKIEVELKSWSWIWKLNRSVIEWLKMRVEDWSTGSRTTDLSLYSYIFLHILKLMILRKCDLRIS